MWNRSGVSPPDVEDLGGQVWNLEGTEVLGTPVGIDQFVSDAVAERVSTFITSDVESIYTPSQIQD